MELLISGATIFGLLQLPSLIDSLFFAALTRSADDIARLIMPLWMYVKFSLFTLIGTFLLHLCLRGHWVALVGMDSVYPGGVRWRSLRIGPNARAVSEAKTPSMAAAIESADNRATRVFGLGFGLAMLMLIPIGMVLTVAVAALASRAWFGLRFDALGALALAMIAILLPWSLAAMIDRRFGDRFPSDHRFSRALRAVIGFYNRIGIGRRNNLLLSLFASHEGGRRAGAMILLAIVPLSGLVVGQMMLASGELEYGQFPGLPPETAFAAHSVVPAFYADARDGEGIGTPLPYIPTRVVRGPYLELFIPYIPRRAQPALAESCPAALAATAADGRQGLDCLAKLADVRVDGAPVRLQLDASSDPRSGLRGVLAMIPVRDLASGRHELSVAEVRPASDHAGSAPGRYRIPFWK